MPLADSHHENPLEELSLDQLRQRGSMKWNTYADRVLPLWVADMDVRLAPPVARAIHEAIDAGDTGYPVGNGLAQALQNFARRRWQWDSPDLDQIARVPDVMVGAVQLLRLVTKPGDAVVVNSPVYAPFFAFITNSDRRVVEAPLGQDHRIDLQVLEDTFRRLQEHGSGTAYLLCNPHNPTGTVHTMAELAGVAQLARQYGVRVIVDEIHAPLVLPGAKFTPYLSVVGSEDAFSLMSATKGWNLAGLKAALALAGAEAKSDLAKLPAEVSLGASYVGVVAHTAAFNVGEQWLDDLLKGLDENRYLLKSLLEQHLPEVRYKVPEATYLAWLDCRGLGFDTEDGAQGLAFASDLTGPAKEFHDRAGVAVSSGHIFGTGGGGHVRLNFGTSKAILTEAVERMGRAARDSSQSAR